MIIQTPVSGYISPTDNILFDFSLANSRVVIYKDNYKLYTLLVTGGYKPKRIKNRDVKISGKYKIKTSSSVLDLIQDYVDLVQEISHHFRISSRNGFFYFVEDYEKCSVSIKELL